MSVILWINGAFGSGKTQTARELHRRIPGSFIYDPENVGYFIWRNSPKNLRNGDFQDLRMWRDMNYAMLGRIATGSDGLVIVPMTICNEQYYSEIIGRLQSDGLVVEHVVLGASKETLLRRLRSRGDGPDSWAAQQIDRCMSGFTNVMCQQYIHTDGLAIGKIVEKIAAMTGLELMPEDKGILRRSIDRIITQLRHIRLWRWMQ